MLPSIRPLYSNNLFASRRKSLRQGVLTLYTLAIELVWRGPQKGYELDVRVVLHCPADESILPAWLTLDVKNLRLFILDLDEALDHVVLGDPIIFGFNRKLENPRPLVRHGQIDGSPGRSHRRGGSVTSSDFSKTPFSRICNVARRPARPSLRNETSATAVASLRLSLGVIA